MENHIRDTALPKPCILCGRFPSMGYWTRYWKHCWVGVKKSTGEQVIGAVIALAIVVYQIHYGIISKDQVRGAYWSIAWPYAILVGVLLLRHLVKTPAEMDAERADEVEAANEARARILAKSMRPDIRGKVVAVFWVGFPPGLYRISRYFVKLELVNHNEVPCTISDYEMRFVPVPGGDDEEEHSVSAKDFAIGKIEHRSVFADKFTNALDPAGGRFETHIFPSRISAEYPLTRGCAKEAWVQFDFTDRVPVFHNDGMDCTQDFFYILVTDSLGFIHEINSDDGWISKGRFTENT